VIRKSERVRKIHSDIRGPLYEEALRMMEERRTEWAEPYYEKLGNCEVVELPGDHVLFLDKPDECSRIIKDFIDGLDR